MKLERTLMCYVERKTIYVNMCFVVFIGVVDVVVGLMVVF